MLFFFVSCFFSYHASLPSVFNFPRCHCRFSRPSRQERFQEKHISGILIVFANLKRVFTVGICSLALLGLKCINQPKSYALLSCCFHKRTEQSSRDVSKEIALEQNHSANQYKLRSDRSHYFNFRYVSCVAYS